MTLRMAVAVALAGILCTTAAGSAADCPGNPNAIGTSRVIYVDPVEHARLGTMQYAETLPLADHEVVLTFDDGPLPPYSSRALEILAHECVKATYFLVGSMARAYPDVVRRIYAEGHTIGTHSQNHPMHFDRMPIERVQSEVENGINSVQTALGNPKALAPFFRIPGFSRANGVEAYVQDRGLMLWSADFPADDWKHISAHEITNRALRRIEAKGRGILLLHDIQPATILALPTLLHELKARGYRIVHVMPAGSERQKTATSPQDWMPIHRRAGKQGWPRVVAATAKSTKPTSIVPVTTMPASVVSTAAKPAAPEPETAAPETKAPATMTSVTVAPEAIVTATPEPTVRADQSEVKSQAINEGKPETGSDTKTKAKSEARSETKSKATPLTATPADSLSATQSITVPRARTKVRISRPAPSYVPQIFLAPLVLSN
jgi:peptidoglycan-N-acetylglucosamine deacetylase